ncbi:putative glutamine-dependent NAD(+) synthetase [Metarhizium anisopliae]
MSYITVAAATLTSVPLDFKGNLARILESIKLAKEQGAKLRTGPELEVPGYGCLDHHLEGDTFLHSWEVVAQILNEPMIKDMLIDVGMGVRHRNVRYNCRVLLTYQHIYMIRPKMSLANDGLYREARHFTAWSKPRTTETYYLEKVVRDITGQRSVPIGDVVLSTMDTSVGCETCEELFTPSNPSTYMGLNGVEVILNSSASHAELRKLNTRLNLIQNCTRKLGDGEARMMFDGSSMILCNGAVLGQSPQFSLKEVEVLTATIDLETIRSHRSSISRNVQGAAQPDYPRVECDLYLSRPADEIFISDTLHLSREIQLNIPDPMQEIYMAEAVYLWQYLTRSNLGGFFIALSGGLDSASVSLFVYGMAKVVLQSVKSGDERTLSELRRITGEKDLVPETPQDIVSRLLHTCYMGTVNSGEHTRSRAKRLAARIGAFHSDVNIDETVSAHEAIIKQAMNFEPRFQVEGGSVAENLAKQNIQARNRMIVAYELSSGNVDEALRGSGDIAPLGSISKSDAKSFLAWCRDTWDMPIITEFLEARPSAELLPLSAGEQDDESESEMGFTYDELSTFGILRKVSLHPNHS